MNAKCCDNCGHVYEKGLREDEACRVCGVINNEIDIKRRCDSVDFQRQSFGTRAVWASQQGLYSRQGDDDD